MTNPKQLDNEVMPAINRYEPENDEARGFNFLLICVYQVLLRVGWIFKTESIIMPAVIDLMGGGGLLRGFLPMFNRFGQSIPPLLAAPRIRSQKIKKFSLFTSTAVMGGCFLFLSLVWTLPGVLENTWLPVIFLSAYALFFASVGICQLSLGTLTGKLVPVRRRGLLALIATVVGSAIAISCAWFILRRWIADEDGNFTLIFAFTGCAFLIAAVLVLFLKEPSVESQPGADATGVKGIFQAAAVALRDDANFRRLAVIAALFGMSLTLFPHYQTLARGSLKLPLTALVPWVIAQNLGAGLFSIPAGSFADKMGNRIVLRWCLLTLSTAPILSLLLANFSPEGSNNFWLVFILIGLTPVTMRTFNNYTLEITSAENHPKYLSILGLCMAGPAIFTSILLGGSVQVFGYMPLFIFVAILVFIAWWMTGRLEEPRTKLENV